MDDWEEIESQNSYEIQEYNLSGGVKAGYRGTQLVFIKDYIIKEPINYGSNGTTYLGLKNWREYVVKETKKQLVDDEFQALKELGHNCTKYVNCPVEQIKGINSSYLITEYIHGRNLVEYCRHPNPRWFRQEFMYQMLVALEYIQSKGIFHRNICPENIIYVEPANRFYLIDFSMACRYKFSFLNFGERLSCYDRKCEFRPLFVRNHFIKNCYPGKEGNAEEHQNYAEKMWANDMFALAINMCLITENKYPWPVIQRDGYVMYNPGYFTTTNMIEDEYNLVTELFRPTGFSFLLNGTSNFLTKYSRYLDYTPEELERFPPKTTNFAYFADTYIGNVVGI